MSAANHLARSCYAHDESLWTVAQALSEILPEGDKEKQMLQGLLVSRERVVAADLGMVLALQPGVTPDIEVE